MPESRERIDLGRLAHLAYKGQLYMVGDSATGTALVGTNFVLFNPGSKGIPVRLLSARVSTNLAASITFGTVYGDPGAAAGNPSSNLYLGGMAPEAVNEAAAAAPIVPAAILALVGVPVTAAYELLSPGSILIPPGWGVVVAFPIAVAVNAVAWLWAELPPEENQQFELQAA